MALPLPLPASATGHTAVATALIKAGAALDVQHSQGFTALMLAEQNGHTAIVNSLIKAGAALAVQTLTTTITRHSSLLHRSATST